MMFSGGAIRREPNMTRVHPGISQTCRTSARSAASRTATTTIANSTMASSARKSARTVGMSFHTAPQGLEGDGE